MSAPFPAPSAIQSNQMSTPHTAPGTIQSNQMSAPFPAPGTLQSNQMSAPFTAPGTNVSRQGTYDNPIDIISPKKAGFAQQDDPHRERTVSSATAVPVTMTKDHPRFADNGTPKHSMSLPVAVATAITATAPPASRKTPPKRTFSATASVPVTPTEEQQQPQLPRQASQAPAKGQRPSQEKEPCQGQQPRQRQQHGQE